MSYTDDSFGDWGNIPVSSSSVPATTWQEDTYRSLLDTYRASDTSPTPTPTGHIGDTAYGHKWRTATGEIIHEPYGGLVQPSSSPAASSPETPWWANTGYPAETSASLMASSSLPRRTVGGYGLGRGGLGLGQPTGKPMPYFEGLTDQMGMPISRTDSKYWMMPDRPKLELPTYNAPVRDENRIRNLIQQSGATGANKLARGLTQALVKAGSTESPMGRKQIMRGALSGYGQGLGDVMSQAGTQGRAQYEQEYQPLEEANRINYEGKSKSAIADYTSETQRINAMYEAALKDYFGR